MDFYNMQLGMIWDSILNIISIINNVAQFILSVAAVIALFYIFSGKYIRPIRKLLYPLGMKRRWLLRILILCRRGPRKNIRVFCEYFILKTQGKYQNIRWWKESIREFTKFFNDSIRDGVYSALTINKSSSSSVIISVSSLEEESLESFPFLLFFGFAKLDSSTLWNFPSEPPRI